MALGTDDVMVGCCCEHQVTLYDIGLRQVRMKFLFNTSDFPRTIDESLFQG